MELIDSNGNVFGKSTIQVIGSDGKPKTISGGGAPSGPAGGDLAGFYPNPTVNWNNGLPTFNGVYYPLTNPSGYISGITGLMVTTALGYTPEDVANKQTNLTASATKYPTVDAVNTGLGLKQDTLISATNIKTINGVSILGSGDLTVSGSGLAQYQVRQMMRR